MTIAHKLIATFALGIGVFIGASVDTVHAAFFDRDKLAQALAIRFNLDVKDVTAFLADFQYNPNQIASTPSTPKSTPSPTPSPAPYVSDGVAYQYDYGTDQYYPSSQLVSVQHRTHLDFIADRLGSEVTAGRMSAKLKTEIMDKLAEEMKKSPTTTEFLALDTRSRRVKLNQFGKTMDAWLKAKGTSLSALKNITGKGNQYLMGIYFD